jgi:hypothetical protein
MGLRIYRKLGTLPENANGKQIGAKLLRKSTIKIENINVRF